MSLRKFWRKLFFSKNVHSFIIFAHCARDLQPSGKNFGRFSDTAFYLSGETIQGFFSWEVHILSISFGHWAKLYSAFREKFSCKVIKTAFYMSRGILKERNWKTYNFYTFWTLSENFLAFRRNFFGRVVNTAVYEFTGILWGKLILLEKSCFLITLGIDQKMFGLPAKLLARLSKLLSTCLWETFE